MSSTGRLVFIGRCLDSLSRLSFNLCHRLTALIDDLLAALHPGDTAAPIDLTEGKTEKLHPLIRLDVDNSAL